MVEILENPIPITELIRDIQQDQLTVWLSIHDEIDLTVNTRLMKPIMLEVNKIAELRQVFSSMNMPYLAFFLDNEYDDFGSFTASKNAHIELYGMNFNGNKGYTPLPKVRYIVNGVSFKRDDVINLLSNVKEDENGVILSITLSDGTYSSLVKYDEESLIQSLKDNDSAFERKEQ